MAVVLPTHVKNVMNIVLNGISSESVTYLVHGHVMDISPLFVIECSVTGK